MSATSLIARERNLLRRHENTIEKGMMTFVEVGKALAVIRRIAEHVEVSDKTVSSVRSDAESSAEIPQSKVRLGKDGRKTKATKKPAKPRKQADTSFEPEEFGKAPRATKRAASNGKAHYSAKDKKTATSHLGGLVRVLTKMGVDDQFHAQLNDVARFLESI